MHKKYLNLSDNFWLSEYLKFLTPRSEILIFDEKNLNKIDIESHTKMWGDYEFTLLDSDLETHINLANQFYIHLNKTNNKYQGLIKEFIYTDLNTAKKQQTLDIVKTDPSWVFLGGKNERQNLEDSLKEYYYTNLDNSTLNELDSKEQFLLHPQRLLKYKEDFTELPMAEQMFEKKSKNLGLSLGQKLSYFRKNYSLVDNFESFMFWNIQVGMFFDITGSIRNTDQGIVHTIKFNRLTIF